MADSGSEPQGTRVVLFKHSSFLFSHQRRMVECRWMSGKKERENVEQIRAVPVSLQKAPWDECLVKKNV